MGLPPINQPPVLKSNFLSNIFYFQFYLFPIVFYLFFNHHCYTSGLSWSLKISKNNYSPNDRFLIKIFIKNISLDSSQRVPPMSPCPPLIITMVCPWLINHLSDPWNFNKSNGILLRSNWRKPYPKFYGSEFYGSGPFIYGWFSRYLLPSRGPGGVINPMLALNEKSRYLGMIPLTNHGFWVTSQWGHYNLSAMYN